MPQTHGMTSKECAEMADATADARRQHLGQQATYLENALQKIQDGPDDSRTPARLRSVRRIVAAMLKGQGIDHPAVNLLKEKGRRVQ